MAKRVNSTNTERMYTGNTYIKNENDPLTQRFRIDHQGHRIYQINFAAEELNSNVEFCKATSVAIDGLCFFVNYLNVIQF